MDTISSSQLPAKLAAEAQSQSGHDIVRTSSADPFLYESLLVDVSDIVDKLGKQHGGWYGFAAEPANYNMAHFKKAGLEHPKTWAELLAGGAARPHRVERVGVAAG